MVEKINANFDYSIIEKILFGLDEDHSSSKLVQLKNEINKLFIKAKCKEVLYTTNNDKLFFGMRVYPVMDGEDAVNVITEEKPAIFNKYYLEFDSKLFDHMMCLDGKELTAILLHEIGHIVYDTSTIDEVKNNIDMYFTNTGDAMSTKLSKSYKEVIAYAMKDAVMKSASIFAKLGNEELIADTFVASCGYGPYLESAFKKISNNSTFINKNVDNRFITLTWAFRLKKDIKLTRLPAIRTLNKAKMLTGSELEKREIINAVNKLASIDDPIEEGVFEDMKSRFSKKISDFKNKGIRLVKNDIYEFNLRLRTAEDVNDLMSIIRAVNNDIAILQDYLSSEELDDQDIEEINDTLQELYTIRQKAAKDKTIRSRYDSLINVTYPDIKDYNY